MILSPLFDRFSALFLLIILTCSILFFIIFICTYLYISRGRSRKQSELILANKRLIYSSPASIVPTIPTKATDRFVFPLPKLENTETFSHQSLNETSSSYKTFDMSKQHPRYLSSDSSYTSSNQRRSHPPSAISLDAVKSKIPHRSTSSPVQLRSLERITSEQISLPNESDSDDEDIQSSPSTIPSLFAYSLTELFRIQLIYKLYYSLDDNQLLFQLIRLTSMETLIDRCFPSLICKLRLYTNNTKHKNKKYFSKKNPINEIFKFDLDQFILEQSYLKIHVLGQHKNDKRLDLGHIALVLNQYENLMIRVGHHHDGGLAASEEHIKFIPIDEDRIDMITQQEITSENEARALISLVYEDNRCLLHVGLIKIIGVQTLLKPSTSHLHHRDLIQIKICTIIDGKIIEKNKSKLVPIDKNTLTFSTSFHFDYLSLHKTSVQISICYRKTLITSQSKIISLLEFGSTQLKDQQGFQHWTDTLSAPNRPHVHWHKLHPINVN